MHDFAIHYLELARNQPFKSIAPGQAINALFDGSDGMPNIRFPGDGNWSGLLNNDYLTFHPDLSWFAERNPEIRCEITTQMNGATPRAKTIKLGLRWNAPLKRGPKLSITFTSDVYADFN